MHFMTRSLCDTHPDQIDWRRLWQLQKEVVESVSLLNIKSIYKQQENKRSIDNKVFTIERIQVFTRDYKVFTMLKIKKNQHL